MRRSTECCLLLQVAFYEILNGLWVRNGLQIKGQAMTYIQCNFCNSMVDADLYLLQVCCTRVPADVFLNTVLDKFHVREWSSLGEGGGSTGARLATEEQRAAMAESALAFLATLVGVRTNLGLTDLELNRLEMVTLLCMGDKTHSQLMELMPERCGTSQQRDFESLLASVADYRAPSLEASGNMPQGMYAPKAEVWRHRYDPLHVLLRAVHRRDFQTSMDRYAEHARQAGRLRPGTTPWPPFREPAACSPAYDDPATLLRSRVFHALAFVFLCKAVRGHASEHAMALVVHLLDVAVEAARRDAGSGAAPVAADDRSCAAYPSTSQRLVTDRELHTWYASDSLVHNLQAVINKVLLKPEPEVSPITYSSDSDIEWDASLEVDEEDEESAAAATALMLALPPSEEEAAGSSSLAIALPDERGGSEEAMPALPAAPRHPAVLMGNEVGRVGGEVAAGRSGVGPAAIMGGEASGRKRPPHAKRRPALEPPAAGPIKLTLNESIISLLLKLHSQLSGTPDSFDPEAEEPDDGWPAGDGPYYIGRLLRRVCALDETCREHVRDARRRLWPPRQDSERERAQRENREREDRRRRAKERQQKLIDEFASKQRAFLETMEGGAGSPMEWAATEETRTYDCVICNQATPSTEDKPMGLVVLVQASSVLGRRRRASGPERARLPTDETGQQAAAAAAAAADVQAAHFDRRVELLDRHFDRHAHDSWLLAVNLGWEGGVHVQTCGHHLHLDCLKAYLESLRTQQRQQSLAVDKGEYLCPLCRQLANSVLPLAPQLGERSTAVVRQRGGAPAALARVVTELAGVLREAQRAPPPSALAEAVGKAMEDMTNSTHVRFQQRTAAGQPPHHSLFLFVTSIARTNLELEVVQRGGALLTPEGGSIAAGAPKRDCLVPLLHVLAVHARMLTQWPMWNTWLQLYEPDGGGEPAADGGEMSDEMGPLAVAGAADGAPVPLLYRDPAALLVHFTLLLPLHVDQAYFTAVVKLLYNLLYYQVVAQLSCALSPAERAAVAAREPAEDVRSLADALSLVVRALSSCELYEEEEGGEHGGAATANAASTSTHALEQQLEALCLPFLRVAALLRHHVYGQPLPEVRAPESEFVRLVYYLELVTDGMDWGRFSAAAALGWPALAEQATATAASTVPRAWCAQVAAFARRSRPHAARALLVDQHALWHAPRLLELPREYERIFTHYHERVCLQCQSVPQETSVCLVCGTVVCLKQACCKREVACEAVAHALDCGAGTALFLVVTSTYVIVIRGRRACLWGSLYLDDFEEEDRDLKRGKPLYLSRDRFQLLEQQWLAHRFDHTKKTWVWHRDAL